jgi:hypothetical protein
MNELDIDFAPLPLPGRRLWVAAAVGVIAGASAGAGIWQQMGSLQANRDRLAQLRAQAEMDRSEAAVLARQSAIPPAHHASAMRMLRERAAPWPELLTLLERVIEDGVTLSGLTIDAGEGRATLEVVASDHSALQRYLAALNSPPRHPGVGPINLSQASLDNSSGVVRARLELPLRSSMILPAKP